MSDNDNLPPDITEPTTASHIGHVYPPRDARDFLAYDPMEMLAAFMNIDISNPELGAERQPA